MEDHRLIEGGTKSVHNIPSSAGLAVSRYSISAVLRSAVSRPALPLPQDTSPTTAGKCKLLLTGNQEAGRDSETVSR